MILRVSRYPALRFARYATVRAERVWRPEEMAAHRFRGSGMVF
jgi:hypothetical protein